MPRKYFTPEEIKKMSSREFLESQKEKKDPVYSSASTKAVHSLHYNWTGWGSEKLNFPDNTSEVLKFCIPLWQKDGFKIKKCQFKADMIQILFEVKPEISPVLLTQRVKGRLDNAFRKLANPFKFSRKVGFRSLGENTREIVNNYVLKQVGKSDYADEKYKDFLNGFTFINENADLSEPVIVAHGRYWYNLHLVIVVDDRKNPITRKDNFATIKNCTFKIADKKGFEIARLAVMPDHIHVALKGNPSLSPSETVFTFMNNLSYNLGNNHCWNDEFYVGTFSEYSIKKLF